MEALTRSKQNCYLRRIDIRKWGSEVVKQFGVKKLPALWLYDGTNRVSTDMRDVLKRLSRLK